MMLHQRLSALKALADVINPENEDLLRAIHNAHMQNAWFSESNIWHALNAIKSQFLSLQKLEDWLKVYDLNDTLSVKNVGLVLAGNIPLVGFHDFISVLVTGHKAVIKLSEKDTELLTFLINELLRIEPAFRSRIEIVDRLKSYDAVIATGSDSSGSYFEKYFAHVPNIIRRNRNGIGVIHKDDESSAIANLGGDIFNYFGLGCRNVSKVYLENGFEIGQLYESIKGYGDVINHHKYKNNYEYSNALFLLNSEQFFSNDFLLLRPHTQISSRIATLNYEYFEDHEDLKSKIEPNLSKIQCVVSNKNIDGLNVFGFGEAQNPGLSDYSDGVDTIEFLKSI